MDDGDGGSDGGVSSSSGSNGTSSDSADGYGGGGYNGGSDDVGATGTTTDAVGGSVDPGTYAGSFPGTDQNAVASRWGAAMDEAAAVPDAMPQAQPAVATDMDVGPATQVQAQQAVATEEDTPAVDQVAAPGLPNANMTISPEGLAALAAREELAGVSNHTHWPGANSGVTIGPGYDMGSRTPDQVSADLQGIGVPAATADTLAQGAGLTGAAAQAFATAHRNDVSLTNDQQASLLSQTVPSYQAAVQADTTTPLTQNQFDALVSYTYQVGPQGLMQSHVLGYVNSGQLNAVPGELNRGNPTPGQVNRRAGEAAQFAR